MLGHYVYPDTKPQKIKYIYTETFKNYFAGKYTIIQLRNQNYFGQLFSKCAIF